MHNYRWRLGLAEGESKYDEPRDAAGSGSRSSRCPPSRSKATPTVRRIRIRRHTPRSSPAEYAHRLVTGGVGHNLPQEAPRVTAKAVIDVDAWAKSRL